MAAFAAGLRGTIGASVGPNAVLDETGLKGNWNFDLKYSMQMMGPGIGEAGDRISILTAIDKQLGLKLEEKLNPEWDAMSQVLWSYSCLGSLELGKLIGVAS